MGKTLLIIGAGCSVGCSSLPADRDFLNRNWREIEKSYFLKKALDKLYSWNNIGGYHWNTYRLEIAWSEIKANCENSKIILKPDEIEEIYLNLRKLANEEKSKKNKGRYYSFFQDEDNKSRTPYEYLFKFADWELKKIVYKTYSQILPPEKKDIYQKLLSFCKKNGNDLIIISFNYDTLLEQAFDKYHIYGVNYPTSEGVGIIKPHGSVNWIQEKYCPTGNFDKCIKERVYMPPDMLVWEDFGYQSDRFCQPALVGLIDKKTEKEYKELNLDKNFDLSMRSLLTTADAIVIVGYSFPSGDRHIRGILRDAKSFRQNSNKGPIKKITMVCRLENNEIENMKSDLSNLFYADKEDIEIFSEEWQVWIERM